MLDRNGRWSLLGAVLIALLLASVSQAVELVRDGKAVAVIVITPEAMAWEAPETKGRRRASQDPIADVKYAAFELIEHIEKMSGAKFDILAKGDDLSGRVPIYLDQAADASLDKMTKKVSTDEAAFTLKVDEKGVSIRGLSHEGSLFGCYELLEQLGVRWFMPGEIGRVIPETKTVRIKTQVTTQGPSFPARWAAGYAGKFRTWQRRMRMGGPHFPAAHGIRMPKTHSFEEKPDCYALIDGERKDRQLCVSNPETLNGAVETVRSYFRQKPDSPWIGIGPHDGRGFCECDGCGTLDGDDWDPFAAHMSMTDRYLWFFGKILNGIADEFPDKKICFYSYASYHRPPVKIKPNPRIVPAFAPITICRIHGLGNPICPEKDKYYRWIVGEWGNILPQVYDRGYWFNLACPGFVFPMVHRLRTQIPVCVMMESRTAHQWPKAAESLKRVDSLLDVLTSQYDIELVTKRYGIAYMKRFFRETTVQGYERAVTKGTFLAGLDDLWKFKVDHGGIGEGLQWYSADLTGGNWRMLRTSSSSWSNEGMRHFKGDGWYRQRIAVPDIPKGKKVFLWFGGVDEMARVWLNDDLLGDSPGRAFVPFEFDVTEVVKPGQENVVALRVTNKKLNEVGTGGITAPVFLWTPNEEGHKPTWGGEDVTPIEFK